MIQGRRLCAIVPARGGSKGIPRKNLYRLEGLTLVERACGVANACGSIDAVYVSTDDPEIYAIAVANGCATPHPRPSALASDSARTIDVIRDLVDEAVLALDDCIVLLQPTSPLRTLADLNAVCQLLDSRWNEADAVVSVCRIDGPDPYKAQVIENGYLRSLLRQDASVPRQSLPSSFIPNGAFYLAKNDVLLAEDSFMPARSIPYMMTAMNSINLDGPLDLVLLEALLEKGLTKLENACA